ncbi:MAG: fatty acid desaturase [Bacteriovoracaceae bacterium]|nr:fatty acid desaturase [Bacteriovoracaceae bacterium]
MLKTLLGMALAYISITFLVEVSWGANGIFAQTWDNFFWLKLIVYTVLMAHFTITAMSVSFHRYHTHKGIKINKYLDGFFQVWLWMVTSMSKLDWVSVHIYHHATSDTEKDPHSPYQKGFWRVFFLGVFDYSRAKNQPEVLRIRANIKHTKFEAFIADHMLLGPLLLTATLIIAFGMKMGTLLAVINFLISPLFAVGGVNALAHTWGYVNHESNDNSRNIGFLFPLNFIICGELDHNNHHAHPKSCSFRHRWYEFDIGFFYITILAKLGLIEIVNAYSPAKLREELGLKIAQLMEKDFRFRKRFEELSQELNMSFQEMKEMVFLYVAGKKVKLNREMKILVNEMRRTVKANMLLNLNYT